eukprot:6410968-Amphidinium_carterae.1
MFGLDFASMSIFAIRLQHAILSREVADFSTWTSTSLAASDNTLDIMYVIAEDALAISGVEDVGTAVNNGLSCAEDTYALAPRTARPVVLSPGNSCKAGTLPPSDFTVGDLAALQLDGGGSESTKHASSTSSTTKAFGSDYVKAHTEKLHKPVSAFNCLMWSEGSRGGCYVLSNYPRRSHSQR